MLYFASMAKPLIYPERPRDPLETWVRAVCGAVAGLGVAAFIWMKAGGLGLASSLVLAAVAVAGCVYGAVKHGDAFWWGLFRRN